MSITCQICKEKVHVIETHLKKAHADTSVDAYQKLYPLAPLLSEEAQQAIRNKQEKKPVTISNVAAGQQRKPMHEVFGFGDSKAAKSARGEPIPIQVFSNNGAHAELIPNKDTDYIFEIELCKTVLMGLEMNIATYLWGHSGVGKTTLLEQVCAHTNREFCRVQHTANTEETDIEGQFIVQNGELVFAPGPLTQAMEFGWVYCADEYDFANPQVLSVYQAVLEGKPLHIKSANKRILPHPNFRFVATGNTNGSGDETGLYMGTQLQNAANYERFGIVLEVKYMPAEQEIGIVQGKVGIDKTMATKLVSLANDIRQAYAKREITNPISPRSVLNAAKLGLVRNNFNFGIECAFINRLPSVSAEVVRQLVTRHLGA
jgi:cobaltochelatase CobS